MLTSARYEAVNTRVLMKSSSSDSSWPTRGPFLHGPNFKISHL